MNDIKILQEMGFDNIKFSEEFYGRNEFRLQIILDGDFEMVKGCPCLPIKIIVYEFKEEDILNEKSDVLFVSSLPNAIARISYKISQYLFQEKVRITSDLDLEPFEVEGLHLLKDATSIVNIKNQILNKLNSKEFDLKDSDDINIFDFLEDL